MESYLLNDELKEGCGEDVGCGGDGGREEDRFQLFLQDSWLSKDALKDRKQL